MHIDLKVWLAHFEYHSRHRCALPEGRPDGLAADERRLIAGSLATFQLGEQSEGRALLRAMRACKPPLVRAAIAILHRAFLAGASLVVWFSHRGVLCRAGHDMRSFLRACAAQYSFCLEPPNRVTADPDRVLQAEAASDRP